MKRHKSYNSPCEYKTLISSRDNRTCGVAVQERSMWLLKLEVEVAIDKHFWGNPKKPWRPKTDPGAGGFRAFHLNFGRAA